jgi:hypothetical protein
MRSIKSDQVKITKRGKKWIVQTPKETQEFGDELCAWEWARLSREEMKNESEKAEKAID